MFAHGSALCSLCLLFLVPAPMASDAVRIQGRWRPLRCVYNGDASEENQASKDDFWTFEKSLLIYTSEARDEYKLNEKARPRQIDVKQLRPDEKERDGVRLIGIYELKGDELRICITSAERPRPREFTSKKGSGHNLFVLQRIKK